MKIFIYLSTIAATIGGSFAECPTGDLIKITSFKEVNQLKDCGSSINASLLITGNNLKDFEISGLERIRGDVFIQDSTSLVSFNFPDLQVVDGDVTTRNLENFGKGQTSLSFVSLQKCNALTFQNLPSLIGAFSMVGSELKSVESLSVIETALTEFAISGLEEISGKMEIEYNDQLLDLKLQEAKKITSIRIHPNSGDMDVSFDKLEIAQDIYVRGTRSFTAPLLQRTTGSIYLSKLGSVPTLSKLAKLESGSVTKRAILEIVNLDTGTQNLSFPSLERLDVLRIVNSNFNTIELPLLNATNTTITINAEWSKGVLPNLYQFPSAVVDIMISPQTVAPYWPTRTPTVGKRDPSPEEHGGLKGVYIALVVCIIVGFIAASVLCCLCFREGGWLRKGGRLRGPKPILVNAPGDQLPSYHDANPTSSNIRMNHMRPRNNPPASDDSRHSTTQGTALGSLTPPRAAHNGHSNAADFVQGRLPMRT